MVLDPNKREREEVYHQVQAKRFQNSNGIVVRTVSRMFKTRFFRFDELKVALSSYGLSEIEIYDALDYMEGKKYIEVREVSTKRNVRLSDMDVEDVEFKLTSEGTLVALSIISDPGIEI